MRFLRRICVTFFRSAQSGSLVRGDKKNNIGYVFATGDASCQAQFLEKLTIVVPSLSRESQFRVGTRPAHVVVEPSKILANSNCFNIIRGHPQQSIEIRLVLLEVLQQLLV